MFYGHVISECWHPQNRSHSIGKRLRWYPRHTALTHWIAFKWTTEQSWHVWQSLIRLQTWLSQSRLLTTRMRVCYFRNTSRCNRAISIYTGQKQESKSRQRGICRCSEWRETRRLEQRAARRVKDHAWKIKCTNGVDVERARNDGVCTPNRLRSNTKIHKNEYDKYILMCINA